MADRQGRPLDEVMATTTSTDFIKWTAFYNLQNTTPDQTCWYLILICAQIEKFIEAFSQNPKAVKLSQFVLKPPTEEGEQSQDSNGTAIQRDTETPIQRVDQDSTPEELEAMKRNALKNKAMWGAIFRIPEMGDPNARGEFKSRIPGG